MKKVNILDCTLRDGGYCNDWKFGQRNIDKIVGLLVKSGVSVIEYGYLEDGSEKSIESTLLPSLNLFKCNSNVQNLVMINYGKVAIENVPLCNGLVQGIRVAFHKKDRYAALEYCIELKKKGYQVFVQPMVTNSYTREEFEDLINYVCQFKPTALYIVDSFGAINEEEIVSYTKVADSMLDEDIALGFHGHDNSKMAFSNAKLFIGCCEKHDIYIDCSVMGMGRGAGNLGTEIFAPYCNKYFYTNYKIEYLLRMIDEVIVQYYNQKAWGYSLYFYLAARENCHPNYAQFLENKKTLAITDMNEIFKSIEKDKKSVYDVNYIEKLYRNYMSNEYCDLKNEDIWQRDIQNNNVLLIAPGKSQYRYKELVENYIKEYNPIIIGVNFDYKEYDVKYVFLSNLRRYRLWRDSKERDNKKLIVTSNIPENEYFMKVRYSELISSNELIMDNAGMMAIRLLIKSGANHIALVGFDGYHVDEEQNYAINEMQLGTEKSIKQKMNIIISNELNKLIDENVVSFITPSKYEKVSRER